MTLQIHVIDTHAMLALPALCRDPNNLSRFFNGLTEMIRDGSLTFPDLVVKECATYATDEFIHTWLNAVAGHRYYRTATGACQEAVLGSCEELLDEMADFEQVPVYVASMAYMLSAQLAEVFIVTEDRIDLPERKCLARAAEEDLDIPAISARDLAVRANLGEFL